MSSIIPRALPQLTSGDVISAMDRMIRRDLHLTGKLPPVKVLGVRGYYRNTFGIPGENDRGVYDDAIFVIGAAAFASFNANVDPSRSGINRLLGKPYAQLTPGVWPFRQGPHKGVPRRFRQMTADEARDHGLGAVFSDGRASGKFAVRRGDHVEWGLQNINIHPGSQSSTGSAGCQTLPPDQHDRFRDAVYAAMAGSGQTWLPYILTEEKLA